MAKIGRRLFIMSIKERKAANKWRRAHDSECGKANPHYTYSFSPTGIGEAITISCHCGAKQDVTDYESW